jgi:lipopolysaccharide transport system permease protein
MDSATNNEQWDLIIRPKKHLLDINLKEIWDYRDLIVLFVRRDFVARYKQTILGPFWFILNPLLSTIIYTLVFANFAKISTEGTPPMLFYLSGLLGWNYFSACLNNTSGTFLANAGIFGKVYFPRLVSPIAGIISNLMQFGIQFLLQVLIMVIYAFKGATIHLNYTVLFIPFYLIILALLSLGFGIIFSSLTVKYRDLTNLMSFGVQLWMYVTPVIYPVSTIPQKYHWIILINPVAPLIEAFKFGLIGAGEVNVMHLLYSLIFTIIVLGLGIVLFNKVENKFMDTI